MNIATFGVFGMSVWGGFIVVSGVILAGSMHYVMKEGIGAKGAILGASLTAFCLVVVVVLIWLFETQLTLVARMEAGTLEVVHGRRIGTKTKRTYQLGNIAGASVEEHGEDLVAAVLHTKKKQIPIFPTRVGNDARRVVAFIDEVLESWNALHTKSD